MESDQSFSGDSSNGSANESRTELVKLNGQTFELPQELCEDHGIFKEFFSMKTWESLSESNREHLKRFLPNFSSNDEEEKQKTLSMLFNKDTFHFTSPLNMFHHHLRQGNYRPEISEMIEALKETEEKYHIYAERSYYSQLLSDVVLSHERVLAAARAAPPGSVPAISSIPPELQESERYLPPHIRAKTRFYQELSAIRAEVGGETSDEDEPEQSAAMKNRIGSIPPSTASEGVSSTMGAGPASVHKMDSLKKIIAAHKIRRSYDDDSPELDTTGISLVDIKQRVGIGYDPTKRPMFGGPKMETAKTRKAIKKEQSLNKVYPKMKEEPFTSKLSLVSNPLLPNIKIKDELDDDSDLRSLVEPMMSPSPSRPYSPQLCDFDFSFIKDEPFETLTNPLKLEDLNEINLMNLPMELTDDPCDVLTSAFPDPPLFEPDEGLSEAIYPNFLCLVRSLFPASSAHRASKSELQARCAAVMQSKTAQMYSWYKDSENWCVELDSALDFLAGEWGGHPDDFVPYLQFMPETQMYQWIGAGRDGDAALGRLCDRWRRAARQSEPSVYEPPPPKYSTTWIVRTPNSSEISEFRAQERRRFSAATKPFSYVQHGYRGVVGPCARSSTCSAYSSLLVPDRPRHVTFMALVRDAVARLPNGEGTRHDILTMIKMTQYLAPVDDQALLSSISTTLDRLYGAKRDPVVKYDHRSAVWTYLHRNRTEEDWLKLSASKNRSRKPPSKPRRKPPPAKPGAPAAAPRDTVAENKYQVAVVKSEQAGDEGSDIDVDVDDVPGPATQTQLSSAQLLKQATLSNPEQLIVLKRPNKGKIVIAELDQKKPKSKASKPKPTKSVITKLRRSPPQSLLSRYSQPTASATSPPKSTPANAQVPSATFTQSVLSPTPATTTTSPTKPTRAPVKRPIGKADHDLYPQVKHTRSLLIKSALPSVPATYTASNTAMAPQATSSHHGSSFRVLTPAASAASAASKSLISQDALGPSPAKKRTVEETLPPQPQASAAAAATSAPVLSYPQASITTTVSGGAQTAVTPSSAARAVPPSPGKAPASPAQTVHLATPYPSGHTLQLSSLQMTQTIRLPNGQVIQLTLPQSLRMIPATAVIPAGKTSLPIIKINAQQATTQPMIQIPLSSVQIGGHTMKLSGGTIDFNERAQTPTSQVETSAAEAKFHTVLTTGQASHATPTMEITPPNASQQTSKPTMQLTGHTVQLPSGQTFQLGVQPVQMSPSSFYLTQALKNAQSAQKTKGTANNQSQFITLENVLGGRTIHIQPQVQKTSQAVTSVPAAPSAPAASAGNAANVANTSAANVANMRVVTGAGPRLNRPILLTTTKPLHNIILQQGEAAAKKAPTSAGASSSPTILINSMGTAVSTAASASPPVIKLQQSNLTKASNAPTPASQPTILINSMGGQVSAGTSVTPPVINLRQQQSNPAGAKASPSAPATAAQPTILINSMGAQVSAASSSASPVIKLQQVTPRQPIKLQGIKIQQQAGAGGQPLSVAASAGARSLMLDGQQLKIVGGRQLLSRFLRPGAPPPQPPPR